MEEENFVKITTLMSTENFSNDEKYFDEARNMWKKILKEENLDYKFKIEEGIEYTPFSRIKGKDRKVYNLNLYAKLENKEKILKIVNRYNEENRVRENDEIEQEIINEEYESIPERKFGKYFVTILMIVLIVFEIMIRFSTFRNEKDMLSDILLTIFILVEIFIIVRVWRKKGKKRKNYE